MAYWNRGYVEVHKTYPETKKYKRNLLGHARQQTLGHIRLRVPMHVSQGFEM